jgi:hypothetical protein
MSKQQTAIDWLEKELKDRYFLINSEPLFEQAKQIEKEQIVDAYDTTSIDELGEFLNGKQYYNETFKSE